MSFVRDIDVVGSHSALLVIDVQNYCCSPSMGYFAGKADTEKYYFNRLQKKVIPNIQTLQKIFRAKGWEIIYTTIESLTSDGRDRSLDYKLSNLHVPKGDILADVIEEIAPHPDEIRIPKTSCSVFNSTNINYVLRNLQITDLVVCGVMTNQCVESAVRDAADHGFRVTLVEDACATHNEKDHVAALKNLKGFSRIKNIIEITAELQSQSTLPHVKLDAKHANTAKPQRSQRAKPANQAQSTTIAAIANPTPTSLPATSKIQTELKTFYSELQIASGTLKTNDNELLRFLNAHSHDVTKAKESYLKYLAWRKENNIDNILEAPPPCVELIKKNVPYAYHKYDKKGRPVYYEKTGKIRCSQLIKEVKLDDFISNHVWGMEYMNKLCMESSTTLGCTIDTFVIVLDLEGLSLGHQSLIPFFKACAKIDKMYYPGHQEKVLILNAPFVAPELWQVSETFLDPTTKAGIEILKDKSELLKYISRENLPIEYGGECTQVFSQKPSVSKISQPFPSEEIPQSSANKEISQSSASKISHPSVNKKVSKPSISKKASKNELPKLSKIIISAGKALVRTLDLKENDVVEWYFVTLDGLDVEFSISVNYPDGREVVLESPRRSVTKKGCSPRINEPCQITFTWDNAFSYWNTKTVELFTQVIEASKTKEQLPKENVSLQNNHVNSVPPLGDKVISTKSLAAHSDKDVSSASLNALGNNCRPLVICGPSGVGKQTLMDLIMEEFPTYFAFSVSHTTRAPRKGEKDGVNYHYTTLEKMKKEVEEGKFIESAMVHGNMYGTSVASLQEIAEKGKICFLEIDVQGIEQVRQHKQFSANYVGIFPPSVDDLESRLRGRGSETEEALIRRLANAKSEIKKMEEWKEQGLLNIVIINNELNVAHQQLREKLLECYPQLKSS